MSGSNPDGVGRLRLLPAAAKAKVKSLSRRLVGRARERVYQPLNTECKEIRVLDVQPSPSPTDALHGTLRHIVLPAQRPPRYVPSGAKMLDLAEEYETISYAWGDLPTSVSIHVNGQALSVPASADEAVRYMRDPQKVRTLWIDAICINQSNEQERAQQVAIMGDVYAHSTCNLVWLGESDESTPDAVSSIEAIYNEILVQTNYIRDFGEVMQDLQSWHRRPQIQSPFAQPVLTQIYRKPWFKRLWVLQEVALAQRTVCHCGLYHLPLQSVLRVAAWLFLDTGLEAFSPGYDMSRCIDPIDGVFFRQPFDLWSILYRTRKFQATVPHDRVYALLGMLPAAVLRQGNGRLLEPDYNRPFNDVVRDAAAAALGSSSGRDAFWNISHVELDGLLVNSRASWIPPMLYGAETLAPSTFLFPHNADTGTFCTILAAAHGLGIVQMLGVTVDRVAHISQPFPELDNWQVLDMWLDNCKRSAGPNDNASERRMTEPGTTVDLASALVAGTMINGDMVPRCLGPFDSAMFALYCDLVHKAANAEDSVTSVQAMKQILSDHVLRDYDRSLTFMCKNRRFFRTRAGSSGIGPLATGVDDLVTILCGEGHPIILRPHEEHFMVVGISYIHGIMDGEALVDNVEERMFNII